MKTKNLNCYINILRVLTLTLGVIYLFKNDYTPILLGILFNILSFIPTILKKKANITFNNTTIFLFNILILTATFIGRGLNFYETFFWWDILVHFTSGVFFTLFAIKICEYMKINRKYHSLIAFLIVMTSALSWEIIEFIVDSILTTNLQEWKTMSKEPFIPLINERGHGLVDSMADTIYAILGYIVTLITIKALE